VLLPNTVLAQAVQKKGNKTPAVLAELLNNPSRSRYLLRFDGLFRRCSTTFRMTAEGSKKIKRPSQRFGPRCRDILHIGTIAAETKAS
jgi:hypothetical protein